MSDVEVPLEDALADRELVDDNDDELEAAELDLEAPEADTADQHHRVELDDDDYR